MFGAVHLLDDFFKLSNNSNFDFSRFFFGLLSFASADINFQRGLTLYNQLTLDLISHRKYKENLSIYEYQCIAFKFHLIKLTAIWS